MRTYRVGELCERNGRTFTFLSPLDKEELPGGNAAMLIANGYAGEMWWVYHHDDRRMTSAFFGTFKGKPVVFGAFTEPPSIWCTRRRVWLQNEHKHRESCPCSPLFGSLPEAQESPQDPLEPVQG